MSETEDRPTPQQIENRTVAALGTIEALWEKMLTPPSPRPGPRSRSGGALLDDDSEADDDTPRLVLLVDVRASVNAVLNGWCRVVIEDHDVEHGIPGGLDVPAMCAFLRRWSHLMAEHEAAEDMLEEVDRCAKLCTVFAPPSQHAPTDWAPSPRTMKLGACPLVWQDPQTADDRQCPGTLRGDEDGWVSCDSCGTRAVMGWWEQQLYGEDGLAPMTLDGVRTYLHREHGIRLTRRGLQSWVDRGHLVASGTDGSSALYDVGAVEAAVTRRQRVARLVR